MLDAFWSLFAVDQYTLIVVCSLVAAVCWLINLTLGSYALAFGFAPVLLLSGLAANQVLRAGFMVQVGDKDTNIALASAVGVFVALVLMLIALWISVQMSDRKSRRLEGMPHLDLPRRAE
jgi:hypothetical protein